MDFELPDLESGSIKGNQQAMPVQDGGEGNRDAVGYTSEAERCMSCRYFEDEKMYCNLNKFDAEPGGHCQKFEVGEEGTDGDDDLGGLEEVQGLE